MRTLSTNQLKLGAAFSFGLATGVFVSGGPRIFVIAAAIPGAAMLMSLTDQGRSPT
jgi:hypothetical protein